MVKGVVAKDAGSSGDFTPEDGASVKAMYEKAKKDHSERSKEPVSFEDNFVGFLRSSDVRETLEDKVDAAEPAKDAGLTYSGVFKRVLRKELNLTMYEVENCLGNVRVGASKSKAVQDCIRNGIFDERLETILRGIIRESEGAQRIKNTQSEFIKISGYLRQNNSNLFRGLTQSGGRKKAHRIAKDVAEKSGIRDIFSKDGGYYFRRDFGKMKEIDSFTSKRCVTFYSIVQNIVAEMLGLTGKALLGKTNYLKRRYVKRPEIRRYLERGKGQLYIRYGTKEDVEATVKYFIRKDFGIKDIPTVRVLYAVWDYKEARSRAEELVRQTLGRVDLEIGFLDISGADRVYELADKLMFGNLKKLGYDYVVINLGGSTKRVESDEQAGDAYHLADAFNGMGVSATLIPESSNCTDRRVEAGDHFDELYITALTGRHLTRKHSTNRGISFEEVLTNGHSLS